MFEKIVFIIPIILAIAFSVFIYWIYKKIKEERIHKIFKLTMFILLPVLAFIFPIPSWNSDIIVGFFINIFIIGIVIIIFFYNIIYILIYKKFNYFVFTPLLIIIFYIAGIYYHGRHYNEIHKVAGNIVEYSYENNITNIEDLINTINIPKDMELVIIDNSVIIFYRKTNKIDYYYKVYNNENDNDIKIEMLVNNINILENRGLRGEFIDNEIIIHYKGLIYFVYRGRYLDTEEFYKKANGT
ncbi:MAG: hypothetical protein LBI28_11555 [Treponema sp.]|jgi:hypothetical protein|nr:hypothetical protein [Treponema sp.]